MTPSLPRYRPQVARALGSLLGALPHQAPRRAARLAPLVAAVVAVQPLAVLRQDWSAGLALAPSAMATSTLPTRLPPGADSVMTLPPAGLTVTVLGVVTAAAAVSV